MGKGPSQQSQNQEQQISQEQIALAQDQQKNSDTLFNLGLPGLQKANQYYSDLATGDQGAMTRAEAPAIESINTQTQGAKNAINTSGARGGTKDLALQEADISAAGQKGNLLTQAYTSSFPALAQIGQGGVGLSINQVANALAGFGGAANTTSNLANQQEAGKATQMSFLGSLVGAGGEIAAACWIAEVLYGKHDFRTHALRYWLNTYYDATRFGSYVMWLYRRFGRRVAAWIERHPRLGRFIFRPIFDRAWRYVQRVLTPVERRHIYQKMAGVAYGR